MLMAHAMAYNMSIIFHHFISVEFIESMLHSRKPRTPTQHSNHLATQATGGALSFPRLTTPREPALPRALSVLPVPTLREAASARLTRSLSAKAATALPATVTALSTTDNAVPDGKPTGHFANATSNAIMPTHQVCRIISTAQYFNDSIVGATSSNSSENADMLVPKVSLVLVSINLLIKYHAMIPVSYKIIKCMNSSISSL
jgi:hypothetical protein